MCHTRQHGSMWSSPESVLAQGPLLFSLSSSSFHVPSTINPHLSFPGTHHHQSDKGLGLCFSPQVIQTTCLVEIWIWKNEFHCLLSFHALISGHPRKTKTKTWQRTRWASALFTKWTLSPRTHAEACFSSLTKQSMRSRSRSPLPKGTQVVQLLISNETMVEGCMFHVSDS